MFLLYNIAILITRTIKCTNREILKQDKVKWLKLAQKVIAKPFFLLTLIFQYCKIKAIEVSFSESENNVSFYA